jgi:hypothetical protein
MGKLMQILAFSKAPVFINVFYKKLISLRLNNEHSEKIPQ